MKITNKQIVALDKNETTVRELFTEVFETKLEVGKWYKNNLDNIKSIFFVAKYFKESKSFSGYGFESMNFGEFIFKNEAHNYWSKFNLIPATKEEVETALINEAKRRGLKDGVKYLSPNFSFERRVNYCLYLNKEMDSLCCKNGDWIFNNGKWAEIIQPKQMTKEEIEKELGYEIEIKL